MRAGAQVKAELIVDNGRFRRRRWRQCRCRSQSCCRGPGSLLPLAAIVGVSVGVGVKVGVGVNVGVGVKVGVGPGVGVNVGVGVFVAVGGMSGSSAVTSITVTVKGDLIENSFFLQLRPDLPL